MSTNFFYKNLDNESLSSIKEKYLNLKEDEASPFVLKSYLVSIEETRTNMINWLSFLCNTLNFTNETLFRSVSLFDQYISKISKKDIEDMTQEKLNLITIGCLSLSTKLEEINCNYISFLNEKVLNTPYEQIFTNKDLTKMELKILKVLKFKTIFSIPLDFLEIYLEIFKYFLETNNFCSNEQMISKIISNIRILTINLMKNNINNSSYLINNASNFSLICFINALNQVNMVNPLFIKQLEKIFLL